MDSHEVFFECAFIAWNSEKAEPKDLVSGIYKHLKGYIEVSVYPCLPQMLNIHFIIVEYFYVVH